MDLWLGREVGGGGEGWQEGREVGGKVGCAGDWGVAAGLWLRGAGLGAGGDGSAVGAWGGGGHGDGAKGILPGDVEGSG